MNDDRPAHFDPYKLIAEVQALLRREGIRPELMPGRAGMALAGAGELLRAMDIIPSMSMEDGLDLQRDFMKDR